MTILEQRPSDRPLMVVTTVTSAPRLPRLRRALILLIGILLPAGAVGVGTMASFSGSTDDGSTVFAAGTLILENTIEPADACLSTSGLGGMTVNDAECDGLFDLDIRRPGDGATVDIDLANVGTMDADLAVHADGLCANGDAGDTDHHGNGDLCEGLLLSIQTYASAPNRDGNVTTGGQCLFGGGTAEVCAFDDPGKTVGEFTGTYDDFNSTLDMGPMASFGASSERFVRVSVLLPEGAGNAYQGRSAEFALTWRLVQ